MPPTCTHLNLIRVQRPSEGEKDGAICPECVKIGSWWVHLRMCLTCGRVGCCDSSPNRHASGHARAERHPLVTSYEPGEQWVFCFADDAFVKEATTSP